MLNRYINYLSELNSKLDKYFDEQREFISCKAGCALCCKTSYYAASEVEYAYVRIGLNNLSEEHQKIVRDKAIQSLKDRNTFLKSNPDTLKFSYECPFLINETCSIYEYRPMLCRSHGLIYNDVEKPGKINAPYCMTQGFNYSNVYNFETKQFSEAKRIELNIKATPKSYDLSYSNMMDAAKDIEFGDVRMMIEWIIMDIPNYKEILKNIKQEQENIS